MPSSFVENYRKKELTTYVYGRIDYRDIFGVPHWATFCNEYVLEHVALMPEKFFWTICDKYNDVDRNQYKGPAN